MSSMKDNKWIADDAKKYQYHKDWTKWIMNTQMIKNGWLEWKQQQQLIKLSAIRLKINKQKLIDWSWNVCTAASSTAHNKLNTIKRLANVDIVSFTWQATKQVIHKIKSKTAVFLNKLMLQKNKYIELKWVLQSPNELRIW